MQTNTARSIRALLFLFLGVAAPWMLMEILLPRQAAQSLGQDSWSGWFGVWGLVHVALVGVVVFGWRIPRSTTASPPHPTSIFWRRIRLAVTVLLALAHAATLTVVVATW